jgi:hypothetical protein
LLTAHAPEIIMAKVQESDSLVDIDPDKLDEEWIKQPRLFHKYAKRLADAKDAFARAKSLLEVVMADAAKDIRDNPSKYGITKVTEGAVEVRVLLHKKVEEARDKMHAAKHRVDVFEAAVSALEHKKRALENLVTLHGQNYFSTPRVSPEAGKKMKDRLEEKKKDKAFGRRK